MKQLINSFVAIALFASCNSSNKLATSTNTEQKIYADTPITQSLFNDKSSSISEENIQKILDGTYKLPQQIRVAIVKLESKQNKNYYWNYWKDEDYLKSQQSYVDLFTEKLKQSSRVSTVAIVPDLLISQNPSFTSIREAAVRMQADIVIIYSITSDIYSKNRVFSKAESKAFATTQLIVLDVRTGLIPFSTIVTKDVISQKNKDDLNYEESITRIKNEAILSTISEIGQRISLFLNTK